MTDQATQAKLKKPRRGTPRPNNGGARPGAGAPRTSKKYINETYRRKLRAAEREGKAQALVNVKEQTAAFLEGRLMQNFGNLAALADGIKVKDVEGNIYSVPPDRYSNIYLIDRFLGRPTERREGSPDQTSYIGNKILVLQNFSLEELTRLRDTLLATNGNDS